MLEQKISISRFQTYLPATDKTQIQGIPGILILITTLSSPGRAVSYCTRSLSNSIPLMNSSHPDNGMNSLQPVWAAASHPRSLKALASPGFGSWPVLFHCQPPWCWLALFLCYPNAQSLVLPLPLTQPWLFGLQYLLIHHHHHFLFCWYCTGLPGLPAVFWAIAMLTQKLCSSDESRQNFFVHCCQVNLDVSF